MRLKLFLLFVFSVLIMDAGHNRGGYINYYHVSGNLYKFRLYTWTNASLVASDRCDAQICIDGVDSIQCKRINGTGPCQSGGPGTDGVILIPSGGGYGGVKENIYESQMAYPLLPGTHIFTYIDANRQAGIINLGGSNSSTVAFAVIDTFYVYNTPGMSNNSLLINNPPIDNVCAGTVFNYNPGLIDPDNDSLDFSVIRSYQDDANFSPCGAQQIVSEVIPAGLSINNKTGLLSWNPVGNSQGEYDISILIKEYKINPLNCTRVLVGQTVMDMPLHVVVCASPSLGVVSAIQNPCILAGSTYTAQVGASATGVFTAPISLNALGLPVNGTNIGPNATVSITSYTASASGIFSWQPSCIAVSSLPYQLVYRTNDSSVPPNANYQSWFIRVISPPPTNLSANNSGSSVFLNWNVPAGYTSNTSNPLGGYDIYRVDSCVAFSPSACQVGPPTGSTFVASVGPSVTSYTDNGLLNGPHQYFVSAHFSDCSQSIGGTDACFVTSIKKNEYQIGFSVSPNPGRGNLKIAFENSIASGTVISLCDILGNEILKQKIVAGSTAIQLDLVNINSGIYFVVVRDMNSNTSIKKIIIE